MPSRCPTTLMAADLKKIFGVYGDFYQVMLGGQPYACRSVLELIAHARTPADLDQLPHRQPDLLVVMMNPGSSKPIPPDYQPRWVGEEGPGARPQRVLTRPDNTQYQIMRLMAARGWSHARVLNLSDLREPKSVQLMKTLDRLEGVAGGGRHSLFCPERHQECRHCMGPPGAVPVLIGWGRDASLAPLARQCLRQLHGWRTIGVPVGEDGIFYAHPSPMLQRKKEQWLLDVLAQL
ncbi:MAG: DUF1643 domain-containing protein [Magnetococcales bacterium]|nr:DUF1643 domain-containing protein [Magnetococcales bacterium]